MKTLFTTIGVCAVTFLCGQIAPAQTVPNDNAITISVAPGARQTFGGLGASSGNWSMDYQKLTASERDQLSKLLWRDLKMTSLRLWLNLNEYQPTPGAHETKNFCDRYITSGLVGDALKNGVTHLLLAPDNAPSHMKTKREGGGADYAIKTESLSDYAALIADFIKQIKDETGVLINVTGVQNEPNDLDRIAPEQFPILIKALRAALDKRDLKTVKIIAPEHASVDGVLVQQVDAIKNDAAAWAALAGIASHSYNMAATDEVALRIAAANGSNAKEYWMTEASENGPEEPGNAFRAASLASRFLSDMNHRVTHWIHFIGFEVPDKNDNATRILAFETAPLRTTIFQKYYYYQQLSEAFDVGAVFRDSQSSLEGDMTWTYGQKPRLTAASARNTDGTFSIGLSNYTADSFAGVQGWADEKWNKEQGGHTPVQTFRVTIQLPELEGRRNVRFAVHRSNAILKNAPQETVTMKNGAITVNVGPLDLVTLRSAN